MSEYALRVRNTQEQILVSEKGRGVTKTWTNQDDAYTWAKEKGIYDLVHVMKMWSEEDWYSKTVQVDDMIKSKDVQIDQDIIVKFAGIFQEPKTKSNLKAGDEVIFDSGSRVGRIIQILNGVAMVLPYNTGTEELRFVTELTLK